MPAYSFKVRFVEAILADRKLQTIRAVGKRRHARPGEELQLYTGMRTKQCKLITRRTCASVRPITINIPAGVVGIAGDLPLLTRGQLDTFAKRDGFADWPDMRAFWRAEHEGIDLFDGLIIQWSPA